MSTAKEANSGPKRRATAPQATPDQSGSGKKLIGYGAAAGANQPAGAQLATIASKITAGNKAGVLGQRLFSSQAASTTPKAKPACHSVRASSTPAPEPKPERSCVRIIDKPTPAAKPWLTDTGMKRASAANRKAPKAHCTKKAKATVTDVTAKTCAALSFNSAASRATIARMPP